MAINLRSKREIDLLRGAGAIVGKVLSKLQESIEPGISTGELDRIAAGITQEAGGKALFRGVKSPYAKKPFPGVICSSVNEQIVHGIPSDKVLVREGDIISIDYGVRLEGYCGDAAFTAAVGKISVQKQKLLDVTRRLLDIAIEMSRPGEKWSNIASAMDKCARDAGFSVVREFVGHGIGTQMHEDPKVPNYLSSELKRNDIFLKEGMILAVEPMVNMGGYASRTLKDGWTVVTKDGKCSAHFEHTIAIVEDGCEVLTVVD